VTEPETPKPASKQDVDDAKRVIIKKLDKLELKMEGAREQQSYEHGSLHSLMTAILAAVNWLKAGWRHFSILPKPPENTKKPPAKPKEDE
jgi:hypothetical protein